MHAYEVRPGNDKLGFELISYVLSIGCLWSGEPDAVSYAKFYSRFK
jgi:hypothetical protein